MNGEVGVDDLDESIEAAKAAREADPGRKWYERLKGNYFAGADDLPSWEGLKEEDRAAWNLLDEQSAEIIEEGI